MGEIKIDITGVQETMLQTLYARAKESEKEQHCIYDEKAIEIVKRLDYDFSMAEKDSAMSSGVIARTVVLDRLVQEYLTSHQNTVVINIACGLDTRCYRMKGKYSRWYNIDLPGTMRIRERFFEEEDTIYQIARSAMDESWADEIVYHNEPVLVIIEGLTMYLSEKDVKEIFAIIEKRFKKPTVFMEAMSPMVVKMVKEKSIEGSQAKFTWGIKNGKKLEQLIPHFHNKEDVSLVEGMKVFMPIYRVIGKLPFVRNISNKIIVMQG